MLWHLTQPLNTRVAHFGIGIQTFGNSLADHSLTLFFQQLDELLLFLDQSIDLSGFVVEELRDRTLFVL